MRHRLHLSSFPPHSYEAGFLHISHPRPLQRFPSWPGLPARET